MKKRLISVVIPVFNEAGNVERLYREVLRMFEGQPYDVEFVFIDDGSTDKSPEVLSRLAGENPHVKYVQFSRNFGKEAATSAGLSFATGDAVFMMDADLQHPPQLIPEFLKRWESGVEVVVGVRKPRSGERFVRRAGSRLFAATMNTIGDVRAPRGATDFRLLDRAVVREFLKLTERDRMTRALIDWLGFRREYIYFDAAERDDGEARYGYGALAGLALKTVVAHSQLPLRLAGYLGAFITLLAGILGLFVIVEQLMLGDPLGIAVSGTAMLAIMILFLNGIVLIALGLMSLYIGSISEEAAHRPLFVVRKTVNVGSPDA